jgi:hypothetical protein
MKGGRKRWKEVEIWKKWKLVGGYERSYSTYPPKAPHTTERTSASPHPNQTFRMLSAKLSTA